MFLNKKKATAEITTALLCRSNIKKDTFKTVAEYLDDSEVRHILDVCISTLETRGISQDKVLAKMIDKAVSNPDSFDTIAENIDSSKLQYILSSCGSTMVKRKRKNAFEKRCRDNHMEAMENISAMLIRLEENK